MAKRWLGAGNLDAIRDVHSCRGSEVGPASDDSRARASRSPKAARRRGNLHRARHPDRLRTHPRPTSDMLFLSAQALGLAALAVDPAHLAVYDPCAAREDVQAALIDEGVVSVEPWAISGWWLCELPPIARTPRESTAALDRIARSGRVEFVSPVHTGLDGGPAFPTTDLLVRFERGTGEQIFRKPREDYTKALLAASLNLKAMEGVVRQ